MEISKLALGAAVAVFALVAAPVALADDHDDDDDGAGQFCGSGPVVNLAEPGVTGAVLSGKGKICVTPQGVRGNMRVRGFYEGLAYTVWWVYIDDTSLCQGPLAPFEPAGYAGPCGFADFFDFVNAIANPLVVFGRMDSVVTGGRGMTRLSGTIRGMKPSPGSQIWMLVFGHGPASMSDGQQLARQLLTPEDPNSGAPHLGIEGTQNAYPSSVVVVTLP